MERLRLALYSLPLLLACTAHTQTGHAALQQVLLRQSTAAYQAVQEGNLPVLLGTVTTDVLEVSSDGIVGPESYPAILKSCKLTSYHLSQPSLRVLNATAAILAYKVDQVVRCGKKLDPPVAYATDVFVNRGGKWLIAMHTESEVQ